MSDTQALPGRQVPRVAVRAAVFGAVAAFVASLGFVPLFLSDDGAGAWVDAGLVVVVIGSVGLVLGPLMFQIREGLLAMRRDVGPARFVFAATLGFCAGATVALMVAIVGLEVYAALNSGEPHWADIPGAAAFFVPWLYSLISAIVVIVVIELVERARRRRRSRGLPVSAPNG